jgi:hypothetical protein
MRRLEAVFFVVLFAAMSGLAAAADDDANALFVSGDYIAAIADGEREGDAVGLTVAAKAALADAELRDTPCLECLERGEDLAKRAIAADPSRVEPYIVLVVTLGRRSRIIGFLRAYRDGIGSQADDAISTALELDPQSSWALSARGGWHIEVVRLAGRLLASVIFGANIEEGRDYYRRGIAAEPENLVLPYQYALSLSAYDLDGSREEIAWALTSAVDTMPRDAYESTIRERAIMLQEGLTADDETAYRALVDKYRGYP